MRNPRLLTGVLVGLVAGLLAVLPALAAGGVTTGAGAADESAIRGLIGQVDALLELGRVEKGAGRSFEEAGDLLAEATGRLAESDLPPAAIRPLALELDALREDLEILVELNEERFYGRYPLARLTLPMLLAAEGPEITEQLFHSPDVAAAMAAARGASILLTGGETSHVVFRSSPPDRRLEAVAGEELSRLEGATPHSRRQLVAALTAEELAAFDRGAIDSQLGERLLAALDAVSVLVVTLENPVELSDAETRTLRADVYQPGEVIQGSAVGASSVLRVASFKWRGFARDRRKMLWPILGTQLLLLLLAMAWATQVHWSIGRSFRLSRRLMIGALLFSFGRLFAEVAVFAMRKFLPEAAALVLAAWWWPALLGVMTVVVGGLIAWLWQAQLTNILPGARGARAVGSLFGLVALGAASYFVAPLLMLDGGRGFANLVPFVLSSVALAVTFGFAARTGPPVPHYFGVPIWFVAAILGCSVSAASTPLLWWTAALTAVVCVAAAARHRIAVARGTEEAEPSPEEAAQADQARLAKLGDRLSRKL